MSWMLHSSPGRASEDIKGSKTQPWSLFYYLRGFWLKPRWTFLLFASPESLLPTIMLKVFLWGSPLLSLQKFQPEVAILMSRAWAPWSSQLRVSTTLDCMVGSRKAMWLGPDFCWNGWKRNAFSWKQSLSAAAVFTAQWGSFLRIRPNRWRWGIQPSSRPKGHLLMTHPLIQWHLKPDPLLDFPCFMSPERTNNHHNHSHCFKILSWFD